MLNIFDEQLFCYKTVLEELNIIPTKDGFLEWFKSNYSISNEYKLFSRIYLLINEFNFVLLIFILSNIY